MFKGSAITKVLCVFAVLAVAVASALLFALARSTDNGPVPSAPLFTFAAAGDFGVTDNTRAVLREITRHNTDFTLALGDLSYGKATEQEWCDMMTAALGKTHPVQLVPGNHDDTEGSSYEKFLQCLPNRMAGIDGAYGIQYAFTYKDTVRFIAIAPALTINGKTYRYTPGSAEYDWLVSQIDNAHKSNVPWLVVSMHEVCVTMGEKTCEIDPSLFSMLVEKKVDLILQGHEHGYLRSHQLAASTAPCSTQSAGSLKEICVTDRDSAFRKGKGPVVVINGSGGVEMRDINLGRPDKPYFADWHGANDNPAYGPVIVRVWPHKLEARFMGSDGAQKDAFVITDGDAR